MSNKSAPKKAVVEEVKDEEPKQQAEKTPFDELNELEKQYVEISQQVERGKHKQLKLLQRMMPMQLNLLTSAIKQLREENAELKKKAEATSSQ